MVPMLRDRFYGRANAGKPLILEEAIDYKVFGLDIYWGWVAELMCWLWVC
jgi:hypothetical protein